MKRILAALAFGAIGFAQGGHWEGKLRIPQHEFGITVDLAKDAAGAWIGSMSVLNTSSIDVPLNNIAVEGSGIRFKTYLPELASFAGVISADGASISGSAANSAGDAPFELARTGAPNVKVPPPSTLLSKEFDGTWEGVLDTQGQSLRLQMKLAPGADGKATAMFIAVDQNGMAIPASTVIIDGKHLQVESRAISGTYKGTLGASGLIEGEWSQGPMNMQLAFKRQ
jgi:hypothetical protein